MNTKMKVEIWSDITCVHCYIANRKFTNALSQFTHHHEVEITWKSFELAPNLKVTPNQSMYEFLAEYNHASIEQVKSICEQITGRAAEAGLSCRFDIAQPANSFLAHRFSHWAKEHNLQNKAKEVLFKAHFTDGRNIDDIQTLTQLGVEIGLDGDEVKKVLNSSKYIDEVTADIKEASSLNIKGVPFYWFNNKLSLTGTQSETLYLETLEQAHHDWKNETNESGKTDSASTVCKIGEECN